MPNFLELVPEFVSRLEKGEEVMGYTVKWNTPKTIRLTSTTSSVTLKRGRGTLYGNDKANQFMRDLEGEVVRAIHSREPELLRRIVDKTCDTTVHR